jgi:L-amino acid N-acyltransferase YncA
VLVRDATATDIPTIADLFNALIPTTAVAWRDHLAGVEEMTDWFVAQQGSGFPVLVAEIDHRVVGYCCWSSFRGGPRFPGYRHTVEDTVHVDQTVHRSGVGRALLTALIDRARQNGVHTMVAGIDADNDSSIEFHRSFGFVEVARMPETGRKFDRWLDLVLMQLIV